MKIIITMLAIAIALCFAQEAPQKLAVYVSGTSNTINKALSNKLLVAMLQNGNYTEIVNPESFQEYLAANGKSDMSQVFIAAKLYGADYVCVAEMAEAFTAYSVTARIVRISDLQITKIGSANSPIKSFDDLTALSNELARQLLPPVALQPRAAVATTDKAIVPYEPPVVVVEESELKAEEENVAGSFGIRAGLNFSHTYAKNKDSGSKNYKDVVGFQAGFLFDIAASDWFHFQPGFMYIQKGMKNGHDKFTAHYLEFPMLMSLKLSVFRLGAGPYFGGCLRGNRDIFSSEFGLSTGFGFDIWKFYIGTFYDYDLLGRYSENDFTFYNRTFGFNLGINM